MAKHSYSLRNVYSVNYPTVLKGQNYIKPKTCDSGGKDRLKPKSVFRRHGGFRCEIGIKLGVYMPAKDTMQQRRLY